jgi:hypothetical protein
MRGSANRTISPTNFPVVLPADLSIEPRIQHLGHLAVRQELGHLLPRRTIERSDPATLLSERSTDDVADQLPGVRRGDRRDARTLHSSSALG